LPICPHSLIRTKREKSLVSKVFQSSTHQQLRRQPDRWLPVLYFSFAHCCLATVFLLAAWNPLSVAGFYYHPRLIALVHLVTLGWISASILGSIYMISPMALRTPLPAGPLDYLAFLAFAIGTLGMVSHFWIEENWGMVWAGSAVWLALLGVACRFLPRLARSSLPIAVRVMFLLAFTNVLAAGVLGLLTGADKQVEMLSGVSLNHVIAHAHLAALGWATMMVMAAGYRLLPMILPSAVPPQPWVWATAVVMEVGVIGLAVSLYLGSNWSRGFGILVACGLAIFLSRVVWMLRNPKPPPKALRRPDYGVGHLAFALVCLLAAAVLGLSLSNAPPAQWKTEAAMIYGCLALLGFLAQMVVGVETRFLPLYGWFRSFAKGGFEAQPPSPHSIPYRPMQFLGLVLWVVGLPLFTVGLAFAAIKSLRIGSICLLAAVLAGLWQQTRVLSVVARTRS